MTAQPAIWTLVLLAGCSFEGDPHHWSSQLIPSGPCWEVNLSDGLDQGSTGELHLLFECLNQSHNLDAFAGLDQAMDATGRDSRAIGLSFIDAFNALPAFGHDILVTATNALDLLDHLDEQADLLLQTIAELIYGQTYTSIALEFQDTQTGRLEQGVVAPALALISDCATPLLDHGDEGQAAALATLNSPFLDASLCTFIGLVSTDDPELAALAQDLIGNLGDAWLRTNNPDNDLWAGATGHAVQDMLSAIDFAEPRDSLGSIGLPLAVLLGDARVKENTRTLLQEAATAGSLLHIASQVQYLADVDVDGIPLRSPSSGDISALQAGARLMAAANTDVECSVDLPLLPPIEFSLGNLSVALLRRIANMDEEATVDAASLLSNALDYEFTQSILDGLVNAGTCPVFTETFMSDLQVLQRLNDPAVGDLVNILHRLLDAVYVEGEMDRLSEMVDLISGIHHQALLPPLEELLRDLGSSSLIADLTLTVETIIDPTALNTQHCPAGTTPLDFDLMWEGALIALQPDFPHPAMRDVALVARNGSPLWTLLDNASALAVQDNAEIHKLPVLLVTALGYTPQTPSLVSTLSGDPQLWRSALTIVENDDFISAINAESQEVEGPLPFIARLIVNDTVTVMLQTMDLLLDSLRENNNPGP